MLSRRETVQAALAHREVGRVPYFINFTRDTREAMAAYFAAEDWSEAIGNYVHWIRPPWWSWHNVPASYRNYPDPGVLPQTRGRGSYEAFDEELSRLREETDAYILVMIYGSHFEKANSARGIENFLGDMGGHQAFAQRMLDKIIEKNMVMLENILSWDEIDGVMLGSDWGSQHGMLMSPAMWREMIAPGEQREYALVHSAGKDVWLHSCGNIEAIMPDLIEIGVDVLNPVQPECMDIYGLKDRYGDQITFWGGISTQQTLPYGTPAQVRAEVAKVVDYMSRGGGYITSPAQEIQRDVPLENVQALLDEAKRWAKENGR
jgi:uroporphyrinogen decarboxylase